jgi:hypothetical protein
MPENVYEPSGELSNLLADRASLARDAEIKPGLHRHTGIPYDDDDLPDEVNGMKVERPAKAEPTVRRFFRSEIADPAFYAEHRDEILAARRLTASRLPITKMAKVSGRALIPHSKRTKHRANGVPRPTPGRLLLAT